MMHYLLISKDSKVQFSHYFTHIDPSARAALEARVIDKCQSADKDGCHFLDDGEHTLVFRWFGPCIFLVGANRLENELMLYEFLGLYVGALHRYFGKFSERHLLLSTDHLHMVLEEMVVGGEMVESSVKNALSPIQMLDAVSSR